LVLITQVYHDARSTECEIHKQAACYNLYSHITPGIARSKVIDGPEDGLT